MAKSRRGSLHCVTPQTRDYINWFLVFFAGVKNKTREATIATARNSPPSLSRCLKMRLINKLIGSFHRFHGENVFLEGKLFKIVISVCQWKLSWLISLVFLFTHKSRLSDDDERKNHFCLDKSRALAKAPLHELKSSNNVNFPNEKRLPQSVYLDFMSHVHFQIALQSVCGVNGAFCSEDFEQIKPPNNICVLEAHFGVRERDVLNGREERINISLQTSARGALCCK